MNQSISEFLRSRITEGDFPSAVYLVAENGKVAFQDALGFAVENPVKIPAGLETIYDLASASKPLITGLLCAILIERGALKLSNKISDFLPEFDALDKREITVQNLLTHTSGIASWMPFYLIGNPNVLRVIAEKPLVNPINSKVVYSDPNFVVLGFLLEKVYGEKLDVTLKKEICEPIGLKNTMFRPPANLREKIAAGCTGNPFERQLAIDMGYDPAGYTDRDYFIWGEVDDGNCWYMGGVAGHAGPFAAVSDVFEIAKQFLPETTRLLKPESCTLFRTNFTPGMNEARSFAFELAATEKSTASDSLPKDAFGHLGFTGTSVWIDPNKDRIFILLTNRTHHAFPFVNINSVRRRFHEIAASELNSG